MKSLCVRLAFFNNECDCYITVTYGNDIVVLQRQRKGQRAYLQKYLLLYPCYRVSSSSSGTIKLNVNIKREDIV